jgi:hypothetical protein
MDALDWIAQQGTPFARFRVGGFQYRLLQIGGALGILFGVGFLGLIGYLLFLDAGPARPREGLKMLKGAVFAVAVLGAGIAVLARSRKSRGLNVLVCTDGLARVQGDDIEILPWEDIRSVTRIARASHEMNSTFESAVQLVLERTDGSRWTFDETLRDLKQLRILVEKCTLDNFLAPALEAVRGGRSVAFGPLAVDASGIRFGKELLPWNRYRHMEVERGQLTVFENERGKAFCKVDTAQVPNTHVLLALVESVCGSPRE